MKCLEVGGSRGHTTQHATFAPQPNPELRCCCCCCRCCCFIDFIAVILVNKTTQVSGAQFYNTPSGQCVVCSPPQGRSPSITIYPPYTFFYLLLPFLSGNHHTIACVYEFCLFCFFPNPKLLCQANSRVNQKAENLGSHRQIVKFVFRAWYWTCS